jgi:hypothetical protein
MDTGLCYMYRGLAVCALDGVQVCMEEWWVYTVWLLRHVPMVGVLIGLPPRHLLMTTEAENDLGMR